MPKKYSCLCQAINIVLCYSRYMLILPLKSIKIKNNHLNIGCTFRVSKLWFSISIVVQLLFGAYTLTTTILRCLKEPSILEKYEWYLMTICYFVMEIDILISLCFGTFKAKRIGKLFERISCLNGSIREMRSIHQQIKYVLFILIACNIISIFSFSYVAYTRLEEFTSVTFLNFIDSPFGVIIRGITSIVSQLQCALVLTLCLLISSKFQQLADTIKSFLEHATLFPSREETKTVRKIKASTIKWIARETDTSSNIVHLEQINNQHQEAMYCLSEINECFGIQLLATFTALLFTSVYYAYRIIVLNSTENYLTNIQQRYHCIISLIFTLTKLFLYIFMGQKISKQSKEPVREIQRGKLFSLPIHSQQKFQSLIIQWSSIEPCYLSACNVINIGPWLLGPIIGNAITYLLVAIQLRYSKEVLTSNTIN